MALVASESSESFEDLFGCLRTLPSSRRIRVSIRFLVGSKVRLKVELGEVTC